MKISATIIISVLIIGGSIYRLTAEGLTKYFSEKKIRESTVRDNSVQIIKKDIDSVSVSNYNNDSVTSYTYNIGPEAITLTDCGGAEMGRMLSKMPEQDIAFGDFVLQNIVCYQDSEFGVSYIYKSNTNKNSHMIVGLSKILPTKNSQYSFNTVKNAYNTILSGDVPKNIGRTISLKDEDMGIISIVNANDNQDVNIISAAQIAFKDYILTFSITNSRKTSSLNTLEAFIKSYAAKMKMSEIQ